MILIIPVSVVLTRTVWGDIDWHFDNLSGSHLQSQDLTLKSLTLKMTSTQVVEMSVNVTPNSPSQDYTHPDDHNVRTYDMTPGFKPFSKILTCKTLQDIICHKFPLTMCNGGSGNWTSFSGIILSSVTDRM